MILVGTSPELLREFRSQCVRCGDSATRRCNEVTLFLRRRKDAHKNYFFPRLSEDFFWLKSKFRRYIPDWKHLGKKYRCFTPFHPIFLYFLRWRPYVGARNNKWHATQILVFSDRNTANECKPRPTTLPEMIYRSSIELLRDFRASKCHFYFSSRHVESMTKRCVAPRTKKAAGNDDKYRSLHLGWVGIAGDMYWKGSKAVGGVWKVHGAAKHPQSERMRVQWRMVVEHGYPKPKKTGTLS